MVEVFLHLAEFGFRFVGEAVGQISSHHVPAITHDVIYEQVENIGPEVVPPHREQRYGIAWHEDEIIESPVEDVVFLFCHCGFVFDGISGFRNSGITVSRDYGKSLSRTFYYQTIIHHALHVTLDDGLGALEAGLEDGLC